jgi:23S rRNA (cytosine1962-C5)-methyltransferase
MLPRITLKPHKEKPVLQHHPWIFSGAIARVENTSDGDTVDIFDASGRFLARGYYNAHSQIAVRVWTWRDEPIDRAFLRKRLECAIAVRDARIDRDATNAYRLVNAESDFLPGLVVDRYADFVVLQFLTLGMDKRKAEIVELVEELFRPHGIYERSDVDVREKEGIPLAAGALRGAEPPDLIEIRENNFRFLVDVKRGHKTGFYLDQRENRKRVMSHFSPPTPSPLPDVGEGRGDERVKGEVLNAFSYTGAFAVYACARNKNARVVNLDASRDALNLARENMRLNECEERGEIGRASCRERVS